MAIALGGCAASGATQSVTTSGKSLTIYISAPAGYQSNPALAAVVAAEKLAFDGVAPGASESYGQRAISGSGYALSLKVITAPAGMLSNNARQAISNKNAIAYLGEITPGASEQSAGIVNAQDLLQVSPGDTALELTHSTPAVPGAPKYFYESYSTYGKTFARVVPNAAVEARAQTTEMKSLGVSTLAVGSDGTPYGRALALAVSTDARAAGIATTASLASANGYFYGSASVPVGAHAFSAALSANPQLKLFAPSGLDSSSLVSAISPAPKSLYVSQPGFDPATLPAAGQALYTTLKAQDGDEAIPAMFGYEAMAATLFAIHEVGKNVGNRSFVVKAFFAISKRADSVLGPYSITAGDTSLQTFTFSRLKGGTLVPFTQVQG
ncbi:MAG TPA: hypothetical protein VG223_13025 [Solirubrobacteraceae bacterium]|nr:hypothetical protein [Solirubrobacteraceae bacterium]